MRILLYESRKTDPVAWDCSTQEARATAYLALFKELQEWGCYFDLVDGSADSRIQKMLYGQAVEGNAIAAEQLLKLRSRDCYEYEYCCEIEVQTAG